MQDSTQALDAACRRRRARGHGGAVRADGRRAGALRDALRRRVEAEPAAGRPLPRRPRVSRRRRRASGHSDRRPGHEHRRRRRDRSGVEAARRRCGAGAGRSCSRRTRSSGGRSATATSAPRATRRSGGASGGRSIGRTSATRRRTGRRRATTWRAWPTSSSARRNEMIGAELGYRYVGSPDHLGRAGRAGAPVSRIRPDDVAGRAAAARLAWRPNAQSPRVGTALAPQRAKSARWGPRLHRTRKVRALGTPLWHPNAQSPRVGDPAREPDRRSGFD